MGFAASTSLFATGSGSGTPTPTAASTSLFATGSGSGTPTATPTSALPQCCQFSGAAESYCCRSQSQFDVGGCEAAGCRWSSYNPFTRECVSDCYYHRTTATSTSLFAEGGGSGSGRAAPTPTSFAASTSLFATG